MPELRQNIITRDWVVIATERARRPDQFAKTKISEIELPVYDNQCPFCLGNEMMTDTETWRYPDVKDWKIRIVANKFPALTRSGDITRRANGIYRSMDAVGIHDVVIEHPAHNLSFTSFSKEETARIIFSYVERYKQIKEDSRIESVVIFRNHGKNAGTSLVHPHSQIVAMPVVPSQVRTRIDIAMRYFDDHGECIFCRTLKDEMESGERIVLETRHFVAFIPYAALSPFHIWIFPKRHASSFEEISAEEIDDLAENLLIVLRKLNKGLNNPDLNYTIRSMPVREQNSVYYHWYLAIVPRLSIAAGFELGSGMYISTSVPEQSAKFLRDTETAID